MDVVAADTHLRTPPTSGAESTNSSSASLRSLVLHNGQHPLASLFHKVPVLFIPFCVSLLCALLICKGMVSDIYTTITASCGMCVYVSV